jgi:hypothetical protein
MGKPDRDLISVIVARNNAAGALLSTSLEKTLKKSGEKILQAVVVYGNRSSQAFLKERQGKPRKQAEKTDQSPQPLSPAEIRQAFLEEEKREEVNVRSHEKLLQKRQINESVQSKRRGKNQSFLPGL